MNAIRGARQTKKARTTLVLSLQNAGKPARKDLARGLLFTAVHNEHRGFRSEIMTITVEIQFVEPRDRRKRLPTEFDWTVRQTRGKACCAEIGCEESVWPGSRFCRWHPKLRLARQIAYRA